MLASTAYFLAALATLALAASSYKPYERLMGIHNSLMSLIAMVLYGVLTYAAWDIQVPINQVSGGEVVVYSRTSWGFVALGVLGLTLGLLLTIAHWLGILERVGEEAPLTARESQGEREREPGM